MKKLIKLAILIAILSIFAFSSNPIISKVRTFTLENGKNLYELVIDKINNSGENGEKIGNILK